MAKSKIAEQAEKIKNGSPLKDDERVEFLSSGSTLLNLALSGRGRNGGWARGHIVNPVGDGSSGKTLLALECAAWCHYNIKNIPSILYPAVKRVFIVYNNVEGVMDFPVSLMYDRKDPDGVPIKDGNNFTECVKFIKTGTVEEMGRDYTRRVLELKEGDFLLYIVDSWDALNSEAGQARFIEAAENDKPEEGSFGTEKAKYGSASFFSNICDVSTGKDATLMIISQTRQKIDAVAFGKKKYRVGGDALNFYTHQVAWLAVIKKLDKTFHGEKRVYGIRARAKIERNKTWKPDREAETTIIFDYGIDNLGSMMDWYWGPEVAKIKFEDVEFSREDFVKYIDNNRLEDAVSELIEKEWALIEDTITPKRVPRF